MTILYENLIAYFPARARLLVKEKKLNLEHRYVAITAGKGVEPEFMRINPNATVPVLVDGDRKITESRDIVEYLDNKDGNPLGASVPREQVKKWLDLVSSWNGNAYSRNKAPKQVQDALKTVEDYNLHVALARQKANPDLHDQYQARIEVLRSKKLWDPKVQEDNLKELTNILDQAEQQLKDTEFLAGKEYTIADVVFTPILHHVDGFGQAEAEFGSRPHLKAYFERIKNRPSYKETFEATLAQRNPAIEIFPTFIKNTWGQFTGYY